MRFTQIDKIVSLEKGKSVKAIKGLALSEEYLQDHFPRFPVMPGVLMLEAMFQASAWLVRATTDFSYSSVALKETKSLKFQGFVQPGNSLEVQAEIKSVQDQVYKLKVSGVVDGSVATSGRIVVEAYNLADRDGLDPAIDRYMTKKQLMVFRRLCDPLSSLFEETIDDRVGAEAPVA